MNDDSKRMLEAHRRETLAYAFLSVIGVIMPVVVLCQSIGLISRGSLQVICAVEGAFFIAIIAFLAWAKLRFGRRA